MKTGVGRSGRALRLLVLCVGAVGAAVVLACRQEARPPSILLVVLDTVRADRASAYGHHRRTTPQLDILAGLGTLFEDVTAPSCWTLPSHATLFTGEPPWVHGARRAHPAESGATSINGWNVFHLRPDVPTLAERLQKAGYRTVALSANPWFEFDVGLTRGFEQAEVHDQTAALLAKAAAAVRADDDRPLFLFMNFMEAHAPYLDGPPPWRAEPTNWLTEQDAPEWLAPYLMKSAAGVDPSGSDRRIPALALRVARGEVEIPPSGLEFLGSLYDTGVVGADFALHLLLPEWVTAFPDGAIVVTADHGEGLGEHGLIEHHFSVYPEALHVPLVIAAPGRVPAGVRVEAPVRLADVHDTVLELAMRRPTNRSLLGLANGGRGPDGPISAAVWPDAGFARAPGGKFADVVRLYREGPNALVLSAAGVELYDLSSDPGMQRDRAAVEPELVEQLRARAREHFASAESPAPGRSDHEIDPATAERLRALGYLGD